MGLSMKRRNFLKLASIGSLSFAASAAWAADEVTLQLNWFPLADHAPFYLAEERGYFAEEDIDLTIEAFHGALAELAKELA